MASEEQKGCWRYTFCGCWPQTRSLTLLMVSRLMYRRIVT